MRPLWETGLDRLPASARGAVPLPMRGVPDGLTFEMLDALCGEHLDESLRRVSHLQLTGWKSSWVYRVFLRTSRKRVWTLVYKNAAYDASRIPALDGLPVSPGLSEYLVYRNAVQPSALAPFVPRVYRCEELQPGRHFRYLLEDLGRSHRARHAARTFGEIASVLPDLHRALERTLPQPDRARLIDYGHHYRAGLRRYAKRHLAVYRERTESARATSVLGRWDEICGCIDALSALGPTLACPVHGDPNRTNALFERSDPRQVRFVDWEWAGVGLPHSDFAVALKEADEAMEEQALSGLATADSRLSLGDHRDVFYRCKMERGLLDAAFLSAQRQRAGERTAFDIESPLQRVLDAHERLRATSTEITF